MAETNKLLEETANYLLSHCFLLGDRKSVV